MNSSVGQVKLFLITHLE